MVLFNNNYSYTLIYLIRTFYIAGSYGKELVQPITITAKYQEFFFIYDLFFR